ncbi:hypothetical protein LTR84_002185 [Exophiala bonariae]|uniref:Vezatin n=1 Tax=Exophiala bonariae TaxID=1690606 RepID=A0AAV9NBU5_9EURO|nr:hypothetical protein LTR84_002185 [Exophiala bonariae]
MEPLIYDASPLAEYLEADAIPFETASSSPPLSPLIKTFAPRGLPKLREGLRTIRQTAASVKDIANEEFLERFRYLIVASQLLSNDPKPRRQRPNEQTIDPPPLSIKGVLISAGLSFSIAWFLHTLRRQQRGQTSFPLSQLLAYATLLCGGCIIFIYFARRQYLEFVRQSAGSILGKLILTSHDIDGVANEGLRFAQEVEVVSRGYEISLPLPPISRLEDGRPVGRCRELRRTIAAALTASISHCVSSHNAMQVFVRDTDLQRYHDIYDVSMQDYADAIAFANKTADESQDSLKELRFLFRLHFIARKVFLCDLLALHSGSTWQNIRQWRNTLQLLQDLDTAFSKIAQRLQSAMASEAFVKDASIATSEETDPSLNRDVEIRTPQRLHTKAQLRRFEAVANAIHSLNAKIRLLRDDINAPVTHGDEAAFSTTLARHYEHLGADLRNALIEWERGRNTMFLNVAVESENRLSRASSIRSPASPSPSSLGGMTVVDGGPAEAFKLLSGDEKSTSDGAGPDEEVFEAVAMPRKRMSWAPMSREEKLNKLQEDRRKRVTMQEQADNTTNMLRELQMVIKHRPKARVNTRITSI